MSQLGTYNFVAIESLTGNVGGKIYPKASNVNVVGDGVVTLVTGNPVLGTLTITAPGAVSSITTDVAGPCTPILGTVGIRGGNNITTDGTTAHRVIINVTGTTNHAVQVGNVGGSLTSLAVGATGEILVGVTGADASWLAASTDGKILTSHTAAAVTWENTISTGKTAGDTFILQAYNVAGVAYIPMVTMTAGANAGATTMDFNTATTIGGQYIYRVGGTDVSVADGGTGASTFTQYGVMLGNAGNTLNVTAAGTDGRVLAANSGANPTWENHIATGKTAGDVFYLMAYNVAGVGYIPMATITAGATAITATMDLDATVSIGGGNYIYRAGGTDVTVADGGTGASAFTQYGVMLGNAGNTLNVTAAGTNGQILRATTGANPSWSTATLPDTYVKGDILTATAANVIGPITAVAVGSVLISNGIGDVAIWSATPTVTTLTATTLRTGDPAAAATCVTLAGTTLTATGTDANVGVTVTTKGTSAINLTTHIPANSDVPIGGIIYRGIATGWSNSEWRTEQHSMQTSAIIGATPTPILAIPLAASLMVSVKIIINGFRDDFSNCVGGEILATAFRNNAGGNITLVGAPIINVNYANAVDTSDIDADVDVGSQSLRLRVIGTAGDAWNWVATATYMYTVSNA
jgi:hypothetical protein